MQSANQTIPMVGGSCSTLCRDKNLRPYLFRIWIAERRSVSLFSYHWYGNYHEIALAELTSRSIE